MGKRTTVEACLFLYGCQSNPWGAKGLRPSTGSPVTILLTYSTPPGPLVTLPLAPWQPLYRCHKPLLSWRTTGEYK
jgi:hypothetical protein